MPAPTYLFLDFDETLSDFAALKARYVEALTDLLSGQCGGDRAAWAAAIQPELGVSLARYVERFAGDPLTGYNAWIGPERTRVAEAVFARVGFPLPAHDLLLEAFAKRMQDDALTACNTAFPGAEAALRDLFEAGVRIQMASSQESSYLFAALLGAGLERYVETKFGPDLVDCAKEGPEFYQRIFTACGIRPSQAIVVDDQAMCLDWAEEAGAKVVQARLRPNAPEPEFPIVLTDLAALPGLVKQLSR